MNLTRKLKGMDHEVLLKCRRNCIKEWNKNILTKVLQSRSTFSSPSNLDLDFVSAEITRQVETMINKLIPCLNRLSTSTIEDKALIEEVRETWFKEIENSNNRLSSKFF